MHVLLNRAYFYIFNNYPMNEKTFHMMGALAFAMSLVKHVSRKSPLFRVVEQVGGIWMCLKQLFVAAIKRG